MEKKDFFRRVSLPGIPQARPECVIARGNARFTVLTSRLLRLEWSPTGEFTEFATLAFPNRYADAPPEFTVREDAEHLWIETGALSLTYRLRSGAFTVENLAITLAVGEVRRTWRPGDRDDGNLRGTRRTLDFTSGSVPLEAGLVSRNGWAVFDDSAGVVLRQDDGWVAARPSQSVQDWYFFGYGHAYADALAEYTVFGGATPLIPRYVLGIWWSRFWPYSASDLEQLVDEFADHALPLDVLVVDMDWHLPPRWTGYTWNPELFPAPGAFLAEMHRRGLRVTLNLHPADGVHPHEAAYQELATALGMPASDNVPVPFRITDRTFAELYFKLLHHPLEEQGVDFWWIDWQQGTSSDLAGVDPLPWLNHLHFADARRRGQRPLIFSRWGGLGNHRYPIGFSGDTFGGWATLASLPYFTATAANVGFGWWSHDIGGHFGAVDGELFTRWVQFGALSPCLRLHAVKHVLAERRPWAFSTRTLDAVRAAFELRYALNPYLYTMARHTHERGVAMCRPMYYAYPEHESAYHARGQYQLGDELLAAPVTEPADAQTGLATKVLWIPPGTWFRFDTGEAFVGPRWVRIASDLETIPLFARAGAIVPTAKPAAHLADVPSDWLDLRIFPGDQGAFRLYEDDGVGESYLRGEYEWTAFTLRSEGPTRRVLHIAPVEGYCPTLSPSRAYRVTFLGVDAPEQVLGGDGGPLSWSYDRVGRTLEVTLPDCPKHEAATVAVQWAAEASEETPASESLSAPFAHAIAYTASDEAQRQLAHLVIVPPYDARRQAQACDAEILWRDVHHTDATEIRQVVKDLTTEAIITAPFALDSRLQPHHWKVETRFLTGNEEVTTTIDGPYINPPIQRWLVRYAGQEHWSVFQADAAARLSITEPFEARLDAHIAPSAIASATIELASTMSIWLDTWSNGSLTLEIDGNVLETGEQRPTLAGLSGPWPVQRFGPVVLPAGEHTIQARLTAPDGPTWVFGVLLVDDAEKPVVRCAEVIVSPEPKE